VTPMTHRPSPPSAPLATARCHPAIEAALVTACYVALAVWATWPIAGALTDHIVDAVALHGSFGWLISADILLVIWALAWDVHALLTQPLSLFDANIFYPSRWALARSDHFLGNLVLFAPTYLATGNAVLGHQLLLLLTFVLSGVTMYLAVRLWTRSPAASFLAGLMFGFAPWRFTQLGHIQIASTIYLPLIAICAFTAVRQGGRALWAAFAGLLIVQALASVYLAVAAFVTGSAMVIGSWWLTPRPSLRRVAIGAGLLVGAAAVVLALSWPYIALQGAKAIPHVPGSSGNVDAAFAGSIALTAADPIGTYLAPHRSGSAVGYYFAGWSCAAFALVGLLAGLRAQLRPLAAGTFANLPWLGLVLLLLSGWALSLGYTHERASGTSMMLPLGWLASALPGFGSLRAPVRLGVIVALALPALAGTGIAVVVRWLRPAAPRVVPVGFLDYDAGSDVRAIGWQSQYQYFSTAHWRPILNGYSGYPPESFFFLMSIARRLPADDALRDLVELTGVRWIVLHRAQLRAPARQAWHSVDLPEGMRRAATFGNDVVFEVERPTRRDLRSALRAEGARPLTLNGLSRDPLPREARRATLDDLEVQRVMRTGAVHQGWVTVRNLGNRVWPGFDPRRHGLVNVTSRWWTDDGRPLGRSRPTRLGRDLAPGESVRLPFGILAPRAPGRYELRVSLAQDGGQAFDDVPAAVARRIVEVHGWRRRGKPHG
jgi:hypothetical protein